VLSSFCYMYLLSKLSFLLAMEFLCALLLLLLVYAELI